MPCFHPNRVTSRDGELRFDLDWRHAKAFGDKVQLLRCNHCIGCNQATQRDWAVRAFHEAQLHTEHWRDPDSGVSTEIGNSSVITLTYDEEHLPADRLLDHSIFQRFMKRLRIRRARRGSDKPIRFFMCGEYGGLTHRPHFHSIIFGESFSDSYEEISQDGQINRMSYELDDLWSEPAFKGAVPTKIGRATVDDFSFAGAAYVAGYIAKKSSTQGYQGPVLELVSSGTGEVVYRNAAPEYRKMSTHPGLGADWILEPENLERVYSSDSIEISSWKFHPPRYYDVLLERHRPDLVVDLKRRRLSGTYDQADAWSPERCSAAEKLVLARLQQRRDSL